MKIYQVYAFPDTRDRYCDKLINSYLSIEKAQEEKSKYDKKINLSQRCRNCKYKSISVKSYIVNKDNIDQYCNNHKKTYYNNLIKCENCNEELSDEICIISEINVIE